MNGPSITETLITPEQFAEVLCDDLDLNPLLFVPAIAQSIRQQTDAFPAENLLDEVHDQRVSMFRRCWVRIPPARTSGANSIIGRNSYRFKSVSYEFY